MTPIEQLKKLGELPGWRFVDGKFAFAERVDRKWELRLQGEYIFGGEALWGMLQEMRAAGRELDERRKTVVFSDCEWREWLALPGKHFNILGLSASFVIKHYIKWKVAQKEDS